MKYFNVIRRHICNPASVIKTVIVAAVLVCGVWGCNDPEEQKREIALSAPDNGATFDLAAVDNINFSWTKVDGVTGYTLKFAMSEAALAETKATVDAGNSTSHSLSAANADAMMAAFADTKSGETASIYWTVTGGDAATQTRSMSIKRLPPVLTIEQTELEFEAIPTAGQTVEVKSNTDWTVTVEPEGWLTVTLANGTANGTFTITAAPNTPTVERTTTVTVSAEGVNAVTVEVTQAAGNGNAFYLNVEPATLNFLAAPTGLQTVNVVSNADWTATPSADWITVADEDNVLTVTVQPNTAANTREAIVTLSAAGVESKTVTVMQAGADAKYVTLPSNSIEISAEAEGAGANIQVTSNTTWWVSSSADWFEVYVAASVENPETLTKITGDGVILIVVKSHLGTEQTATITISGEGTDPQTITVKQLSATAKSIALSQDKVKFEHQSNQSYIEVTSNTMWSASIPASASWLTARFLDSEGMAVTAPVKGGGTLILEATANTGEARTATITVSGEGAASKTITVTQAKNPPPYLNAYTPEPIPANGSSIETYLSIESNVAWELAIEQTGGWLTAEHATGEGRFGTRLYAQPNQSEDERTATITVTGTGVAEPVTVTVTQRGNVPYIEVQGTDQMEVGANQLHEFQVVVSANIDWSPSTTDSWIHLGNKTPHDGMNGEFSFTVDENTATTERTGTITIRGGGATATVTVRQQGMSAELDIEPYSIAFAATPAASQTVNINSNVAWAASTTANWITLAPATGEGNGNINITAATNTGAARSATVTLTGEGMTDTHSFAVTQAGTSGGSSTEIQGTWYLRKVTYPLNPKIDGSGEGMADMIFEEQFTLNAAGTWTGSILGDYEGDGATQWNYAGGMFTITDIKSETVSAVVTSVSAAELKLQMGDPSGSEYYEIEYQRTPYTVPAMPTETSISRYTGSTAPFIGTWKQIKVENAFQYTGGNLQWYIENYTNGSVLQVNDDNTWTSTGGTNSGGGTWSFNPTNGEISLNVITPSGEVSMVYIIEASSNASTLVYAEFNSDIDGEGFTRTTLAKQ